MPATKPRAYQVYDIDWKQAVRALSDSNINLASPGALVIDAVVLDPYDRVLLTAQTNATENGIYQVNAAQTLLVPAPDWVNINSGLSSAVNSGLTVAVTEGADYAQTTWTLTTPNPVVIGVTAIVFEPVPEASDRIGNIYFDGATIELANGASETAIAIRPNGASGLAGITIPDDAAANSFSLNIFNFANRGNVKIDTNSGDWVFDYSGNLTATGYITANYFVGDGGLLSNISVVDGYSNANVANYLPTYSGNLASLTGNVTTNANISGSYILGNGRQLSGIDRISNGTSNIVILDNGNVEITSGSETWFFINSGAMHCPPVSTIYAEGTGEMSLQVANNTIAEATINLGYNGPESTYIQIVAESEDERLAQFELTANDGSNNFARIITFDGNSQNYFWKFSGEGIFLVPGDIIPVANGSRSLGNVTNQWNDLYVSNNTIYLGNVPLAVTSANGLTIGGQTVLSNGSNAAITTTGNITANYFIGNGSQLTGLPAAYSNVNVAAYLPTYTGNITAGNVSATGNITGGNVNTGKITLTNGAMIRDTAGDAVAIGQQAGETSQGNYAVALGFQAAITSQGIGAVAIGREAGNAQGAYAVAIGQEAGFSGQSSGAIAIGLEAGETDQGGDSVAIGYRAGGENQDIYAVAIGYQAGNNTQGGSAVAIGEMAGTDTQGVSAVAVGDGAGRITQGEYAVALGRAAGDTNQGNNSIIINATGGILNQTTANTFTVAPIRNDVANVAEVVFYNITSKEITYGNAISVTGNITGGNIITAGNVSGNIAGFAIGYRDIPQVSFTGNATIAAADAGKHFYSTESTNYVLTIANNSSQVFQVGTAITVVNRGTGTITIAQGSGVSLYLAGNSTAGNRTISTYGMASLLNVAANVWMINGTGVT